MRPFARLLFAAALCLGEVARADGVVLFQFEGDKRDRLRTQVEQALGELGQVKIVPLATYKQVAARKRLKGADAFSADAFSTLAQTYGWNVAVAGVVSRDFQVFIYDAQGQQVWNKALGLKRGQLSDKIAGKLAKAIVAAAAATGGAAAVPPEAPPSAPPPEEPPPPVEPVAPPPQRPPSAERQPLTPLEDEDIAREARRPKKAASARPPGIVLTLQGLTTWRSYCSRPGVDSCAEYAQKEPKAAGPTSNFSPDAPFAGFSGGLEAFPLVYATDSAARGIGVVGNYGMGFSRVILKSRTEAGDSQSRTITATMFEYSAQLAYRYYFSYGGLAGGPTFGHVGIRGGWESRSFLPSQDDIKADPTGDVALLTSSRSYPIVGLDVALPLMQWLRVDLGGSYLIGPKPGALEIKAYGSPNDPSGGATAAGFLGYAGLSGQLYGPVGYRFRFQYTSYSDRFLGQGERWTTCNNEQCGGVAQETWAVLYWGLQLAF